MPIGISKKRLSHAFSDDDSSDSDSSVLNFLDDKTVEKTQETHTTQEPPRGQLQKVQQKVQQKGRGGAQKRLRAIDDLMKQQATSKTRSLSDIGADVRPFVVDDIDRYRSPNVPKPASSNCSSSSSRGDPSRGGVRRGPLHQSMTPLESSSLRASISSLGPAPTVGAIKSAVMSLFPKPQKAHSAISTVRAYVGGEAPPEGCDPELMAAPGGGTCWDCCTF